MTAPSNASLLTLDRLRLAQTRNASATVRSGAPRTGAVGRLAVLDDAPQRPTLAQVVRRLATR